MLLSLLALCATAQSATKVIAVKLGPTVTAATLTQCALELHTSQPDAHLGTTPLQTHNVVSSLAPSTEYYASVVCQEGAALAAFPVRVHFSSTSAALVVGQFELRQRPAARGGLRLDARAALLALRRACAPWYRRLPLCASFAVAIACWAHWRRFGRRGARGRRLWSFQKAPPALALPSAMASALAACLRLPPLPPLPSPEAPDKTE